MPSLSLQRDPAKLPPSSRSPVRQWSICRSKCPSQLWPQLHTTGALSVYRGVSISVLGAEPTMSLIHYHHFEVQGIRTYSEIGTGGAPLLRQSSQFRRDGCVTVRCPSDD